MMSDYRQIASATIFAACALVGHAAVAKQPLLCVLVPHFKDEYWLSVAYGLEHRSAELGLAVRFLEAGGYNALDQQIEQVSACTTMDASAILIGAVSSNAPEMLAAVQRAAQARPVIGLVNELHSTALAARVGVDWEDMGLALGRSLAARFPATGTGQRAILLTGPLNSGWVGPLEDGLRHGLAGSALTITAVYNADTGTSEQLRLLETALSQHPDIDLVIGSAPAIEAAMAFLRREADPPLLAATYLSHSVARGLAGRQVIAAPFDDPIEQGRLAVDAAVAAMAGQRTEALLSTGIRVREAGADPAEIPLSPADYFPAID
jgi:protein TorT